MTLEIVLCIVVGYLFGSIPFGYLIGKFKHIDIRDYGSGNSGTTNAFRTVGKAGGIITFLGDFLKALIPILIMKYVIFKDCPYLRLLILIYGFACVLGHNFPVWLKFKGGKGIAVTGGVFIGFDYWIIPLGVLVFGGIVLTTKYVSVGSLAISILFPIWIAIRGYGEPYYGYMVGVGCLFMISAFIMHRKNIERLKNGTENKIGHRVSIDVK